MDFTSISMQRDDAVADAAHVADELGAELAPQVVHVHLDALLPTSSPQPYTASSSCSRDTTAPGSFISASSTANSRAESSTGAPRKRAPRALHRVDGRARRSRSSRLAAAGLAAHAPRACARSSSSRSNGLTR